MEQGLVTFSVTGYTGDDLLTTQSLLNSDFAV